MKLDYWQMENDLWAYCHPLMYGPDYYVFGRESASMEAITEAVLEYTGW